MEIDGAVGIVTGASRGIGSVVAEALAAKGVDLALAARSQAPLEAVVEKVQACGVRAIGVPTDVTDRGDLERLVERVTSELGSVDLVVNNAGVEHVGHFEKTDLDRVATTIATNVSAVIALARLVVPGMIERRRGHICNVASTAGKAARPFGSVYAATKHAVVGFSWSLRAELARHGIEVSVVCPHYVTGIGMFAPREAAVGEPPRGIGPVTAEEVAQEVVETIERNRAEAVVAPPLVKVADVSHALSPDMAIKAGWRSGYYRYLEREATVSE